MKPGDTVYIVESNRIIREVIIVRCSGGMYLIRFKDSGGGIQVKKHRLFETKESAEESIGIKKSDSKGYGNPYNFDN